jgi:adenine phosphoribosyltransferase
VTTDRLADKARAHAAADATAAAIKARIRTIPGYPRPGIMFRDITTLLQDRDAFRLSVDAMVGRYRRQSLESIVGIESRGFIFGSALAYALGTNFVPIRKQGRLPAQTIGCDYELEYGNARMEMHTDALEKGAKVVIVDDLIATGGTADAAATLVKLAGAVVIECCFVVDLPDLGGRRRLEDHGIASHALCAFEGE